MSTRFLKKFGVKKTMYEDLTMFDYCLMTLAKLKKLLATFS